MKDSLIFTVFIPTVVVSGIYYFVAANLSLGIVMLTSFLLFMAYELAIRKFTKYQKLVEERRLSVLERVAALTEMMTHKDISPSVQMDYVQFYNKLESVLRLYPKSWITYWIVLDEQIKLCQIEVSRLVKQCNDDINEANIARESIPGLLESIPKRIASMEWISTPLIENTRAYTYMCSAKDYYKKAVDLYECGEFPNLPVVFQLLEESNFCMDWADKICPHPEYVNKETTVNDKPAKDIYEHVERPNRGTKLV